MKNRIIQTEFIRPTGRKCQACWKCVEACPESVLGKVNFLFHKHAIIVQPDKCIGCLKCVKICEYGVITKK